MSVSERIQRGWDRAKAVVDRHPRKSAFVGFVGGWYEPVVGFLSWAWSSAPWLWNGFVEWSQALNLTGASRITGPLGTLLVIGVFWRTRRRDARARGLAALDEGKAVENAPSQTFRAVQATRDDLAHAIYSAHVSVSIANLHRPDASQYVEFTFFGFNGLAEASLSSVDVAGKLIYAEQEVDPWMPQRPSGVSPWSEFMIGVRMVVSSATASRITDAIAAGSHVEFGLSKLEIKVTADGGATTRLRTPAAVRCSKGIQVGRVIAASANMTAGRMRASGGLPPAAA